jgi:dTDP-4-dehydrorhamnose reductase
MKNILVLGAAGQIGSELVPYLRNIYGSSAVVAAYRSTRFPVKSWKVDPAKTWMPWKPIRMHEVVKKYKIDSIINLVAVSLPKVKVIHPWPGRSIWTAI